MLTISRLNWFVGALFFVAAFGALISPPPYIAIALLSCMIGSVFLPLSDESPQRYFNWQVKGGTKGTIILVSFIFICLVIPQVETDPARFSNRPIITHN